MNISREEKCSAQNVSEIDAHCYILVDGDGTYPAESAAKMVKLVQEHNADMVVGDRLSSTYFEENKRPFHNIGNCLVRGMVSKLFHTEAYAI